MKHINDKFIVTQNEYNRQKRVKVWGGISLTIISGILFGVILYSLALSAGVL